MDKLNTKVVALSIGALLAVLSVLCVIFDLLLPAPIFTKIKIESLY